MRTSRQRIAFTLVELLVVIAIIGILVALLMPAVQAARESARAQCGNNFKNVALGMHVYHDSFQSLPPGVLLWRGGSASACGTPAGQSYVGWGWGALILPYLEEGNKHSQIDFKRVYGPLNVNKEASAQIIDLYLCPSDPQGKELVTCCSSSFGPNPKEDVGRTNMAGVSDTADWTCDNLYPKSLALAKGVMATREACSIPMIRDGTSQTLMLGEVTGNGPGSHEGYFWATWDLADTAEGINGGTSTPAGGQQGNLYTTGFSSYHPGGCLFVFCDGSTHFLDENIDQKILDALATRANRDVVPGGGF